MRSHNFSAGPSAVPTEVLEEIQAELLDWQGLGYSAMETSHRSPQMIALYQQLEADLRELLAIPADYHIILSSGGASAHSAFLPMNLLGQHTHADYVITGTWSDKSYHEAKRYAPMHVVANGRDQHFRTLPDIDSWDFSSNAAYCHLASNETIHGVQFKEFPTAPSPLVVDMSSDILSQPIDVSQFGVIYAGAQKNMGPAGLTLVIIHRDLLKRPAHPLTPTVFNYRVQTDYQSMANTPPTFNWYCTAKIVQYLKKCGGLTVIAARNQAKAQLLYDCLDRSHLFHNPVDTRYRSTISIPFFLPNEDLTHTFLQQAVEQRLFGLKGHQILGGLRACLYNAVPLESVQALVQFMTQFEAQHG